MTGLTTWHGTPTAPALTVTRLRSEQAILATDEPSSLSSSPTRTSVPKIAGTNWLQLGRLIASRPWIATTTCSDGSAPAGAAGAAPAGWPALAGAPAGAGLAQPVRPTSSTQQTSARVMGSFLLRRFGRG